MNFLTEISVSPASRRAPFLVYNKGNARIAPASIPDTRQAIGLLLGHSCVLGRNRTCDLLDRNQTLYPLSYEDIFGNKNPEPKNSSPPKRALLNMKQSFKNVNKGGLVALFLQTRSEGGSDLGRGDIA